MKKRIMSALLAAAMVFTLLPAAAWAATPIAGESGVSQERAEIPLGGPRDSAPAVEDVPVAAAEEIPADEEARTDAADEPLPELPEDAPAAPLTSIHTAGADEPMAMALESGIPYLDWDDSQKKLVDKTCDSATTVESTTTAWDGGWYVVSASVTIESRITVTGEVHLILEDGFTLTAKSGIGVSEGNSLTIYGQTRQTGKLKATSNSYNAGIGGNHDGGSGSVTINGGDITAEGTSAGAGIGGGRDRAGGAIVINGGTVSAKGQVGGAGIGGGSAGDGGSITINGGNVTAQGRGGAGIGGGDNGNGGTVTITGGTVKTTGGTYGAGIGGGEKGSGGAVTITGGTVTANGGSEGAGIGGGQNGAGGTVTITGGTVTTKGGTDAAGIGGGNGGDGGTVTINGGTVTANGDTYVASIGGGQDGGNNGSFSTGESGNAVIFASSQYVDDSIADTSRQASWSGIIFNGNTGEIYGAPVPGYDFNIQSGKTLNVKNGQTLHIGAGVTMTNNGAVNIGDASNLNAVLDNEGTINNKKTIDVWGQLTNGETGITNQGSGQIVYHFELEVTPPTFDEAKSGYAQPEAKSITITSTAEIDATITSVRITGEDFVLNHGNNATLANGVSDTSWTVQPKAGLSVGAHTAAIAVTYSGSLGAPDKTATAEVTFTVSSMAEGSGTADVPYRIPDLATLEAVRDYINSGNGGGEYFKLTDDIDMSTKYNEDSGTSWTPIGTHDDPFQGTFDGDGREISGLYLSLNATGEEDSVGLFGENAGTICDLTVSGTILAGDDGPYAGEIVGTNTGTVTGCTSAGSVTIVDSADRPSVVGAGGTVGGIVGSNTGTVTDCDSFAKITVAVGSDEDILCAVGGIVGMSGSMDYMAGGIGSAVKNCRFSGQVTGSIRGDEIMAAGFGGIVGMTLMMAGDGVVEGCVNTGSVSGSIDSAAAMMGAGIGGIMGSNLTMAGAARVKNCVNTGGVYADGNGGVGGIAGVNVNLSGDPGMAPAVVEHCYNTGAVTGTGAVPGAVVGANAMEIGYEEPMTGQVVNCYYLSGGVDGIGAGEGEAEAKTAAQFASGEVAYLLQDGQDTQVWGQELGDEADEYPVLTSDGDKKVYKVTFATSAQPEYAAQYANHNGTVELPAEPTLAGTAFDHWSTVDSAGGGAKFDNTTQVTGDVTVYAVGQSTFGGESDEIALTTTYGTALTEDLSEHMAYQLGAETAGKFAYEITAGNDALNATIEGDILTIPGTANAESYTLTIRATEKEPAYSLMSVENYGTNPVTLTVKVTIDKAASTATPPTAKRLTYNGAAQELVEAGNATGGEMRYSLDGSDYSADIPTGAAAEAYTVWYKVAGDANHNDTEPAKVEVTIAQAAATVTEPKANTPLIYTGTAQELITAGSVTSDVPGCGTMRYSLTEGSGFSADIPTGESAKTYTVYWQVDGADETNYAYSAATSGQVEVTIAKAQAVVTEAPKPVTATYTGDEIALVTAGESSFGALAYSINEAGPFTEAIPAETEAGTYTVYYMVEGTDNWSASEVGHVRAEIKKAASSATVTGSAGLVYSGEPQPLVASGASDTGTVVYALGDSATAAPGDGYTEIIPTGTNAGTYYVWWKVLGDVDHGDTAPVCLTVTIAKAESSATAPEAKTLTYNGEVQALVETGSATGGAMKYALGDEARATTDYSDAIPEGTDAGIYYVWYKVAGDANHNDTEPDKVEVTIAQATATVTAPTAKTPLTYNGTAQELITAGSVTSDVLGYGEMRYSLDGDAYSAHIPMGESAQAYTVYWKVDGADETNYMYSAKTSGQVEVTIAKAAAQVIVPPAARDLTYTGEEQALVTAGESSFGALAYSLAEAGPFTDEIPTATEAGTYTVYYMVEGSDNWNASPVGSVPVEIHPADSSATVRRRTGLVYSGQPQALVTAGNVTGGQLVYALGEDAELVPASGYESRTPTGTAAGTYYVWWKILGDVDHGDTAPACLTVTIAPFPLTLEPVAAETPYTGAAIFVTVTQTAGQTPAIDPAKIAVSYEQNGAAAEPVLPGTYDVLAAVTDPNFTLAGAAKVGTLTITHVHVYAEEWTHDGSNHWHVCQGVGECDAPRSALAAHTLTWVDGGDGTGHQVCAVCGYTTGEHTHASETWHVDEASGQHYKTCDACGAAFDRAAHALTWVAADPALHGQACAVCGWAGEKSAHVWDGGVVTREPTAEAEGSRVYTCAVCGATRSEPISKLDTFQISGAVTDQAGAPLPRAAVRLTRGQETVAETVTDDQGRYSFSSVPAGLYNVAATWEDVTKTILVELSHADADQRDIRMPSGKVSSVVEVLGEDTPDVVVGGVDAIAEAEAASPAETVTVTLTVAKEEVPADKDEIDQLITGQRDNVLYLDVSLLKQINTQPTQAITDTGVRVLEIIVPYDFTGKRSVTVYRKHGTDPAAALTALSARPDLAAAEDGTFFADEENGWIAIYASKFSTYAIGYQTAASGASSVARYVLTATAGEGGTIDPAGAIRVRRGADQSYAIRPEAGYAVADVLVDGASVGAATAYTFENVAAAHTIQAIFRKAGEGADGLPFTDVAPGDWFYDSVREVYRRGLMQGVDAITFAPMQGATRATVVTILYRLTGSPAAQADLAYADVSGDAWYAQAIRWAEETGVAIGYGDGRFGPDDPITREQLALMLWRYAAIQGRDVSVGEDTNILSYQDFDQIADWAIPGLQWAAGSGVLRGTASGTTLSPKTPATRAELAAILARYLQA